MSDTELKEETSLVSSEKILEGEESSDGEEEDDEEEDVGLESRWDVKVRPDKNGDYYYEDISQVPTGYIISCILCFVLTILSILSLFPWDESFSVYNNEEAGTWIGLASVIALLTFGLFILFIYMSLIRFRSYRTTFSDQTQTVCVFKRYKFLPFKNEITYVPYKDVNEFVNLKVGEKQGFSKLVGRFIIYLMKNDCSDVQISGKIKYKKEAESITYYLNEALMSKIPI